LIEKQQLFIKKLYIQNKEIMLPYQRLVLLEQSLCSMLQKCLWK